MQKNPDLGKIESLNNKNLQELKNICVNKSKKVIDRKISGVILLINRLSVDYP